MISKFVINAIQDRPQNFTCGNSISFPNAMVIPLLAMAMKHASKVNDN